MILPAAVYVYSNYNQDLVKTQTYQAHSELNLGSDSIYHLTT